MANWQVISLDTTTPQLRAPGTGDGYSFNSGSTQLGVWTTTGLGIGTANPAGKLVVSNAGAAGIEFYPTGGVGGGSYLGTYNRSTSAYIPYTNYASTHTWFVSTAGNIRAMDLDTSGNLGIGTTSPSYRLHVVGATTSVSAFRRTTADDTQILIGNTAGDLQIRALANGNGLIYSDTGKTLGFGSNGSGTAQLTLDTSGNLGLGVTPSAWSATVKALEQPSGAFASISTTQLYAMQNLAFIGGSWVYKDSAAGSFYRQQAGAHSWITVPSGTAGAVASLTTQMTLDASGNLLVGTTSAYGKLTVFANNNGANDVWLRNESAGSSSQCGLVLNASGNSWRMGMGSTANNSNALTWNIDVQSANTELMRLTTSGSLAVGTSTARGDLDVSSGNTPTSVTKSIHLGYSASNFYGFRLANTNAAGSFAAGTFSIQRGTTAAWNDDFVINDSGNVGIGNTTGLSGKLGISGNLSLSGAGTGGRFVGLLDETSAYAGALSIQAGGGSTGYGGGITMYGHSHATYPGSVWIGRSSGSTGPIMFGSGGIGPGTEQMRIDSSGRLLVGGTSAIVGASNGSIEVQNTAQEQFSLARFTNGSGAPTAYFNKSRGATVGTNTIVNNGDFLGILLFRGANGTGYSEAAGIFAAVDGTPGASNDMPGRLIFATAADGTAGAVERMRISNAGNVVVNTAAVATTATDGFLYIPTCAGAPTGVPTTFTGCSPLVVDSTNNRFYVYVNGAWKYATLT